MAEAGSAARRLGQDRCRRDREGVHREGAKGRETTFENRRKAAAALRGCAWHARMVGGGTPAPRLRGGNGPGRSPEPPAPSHQQGGALRRPRRKDREALSCAQSRAVPRAGLETDNCKRLDSIKFLAPIYEFGYGNPDLSRDGAPDVPRQSRWRVTDLRRPSWTRSSQFRRGLRATKTAPRLFDEEGRGLARFLGSVLI
jgi:hypothetical protein